MRTGKCYICDTEGPIPYRMDEDDLDFCDIDCFLDHLTNEGILNVDIDAVLFRMVEESK